MNFPNIFSENIITILIITIIIIIFIVPSITINNLHKKSISGLWEVDSSFATESEVDRFIIYFEPEKENICWILITKEDKILVNHITKFKSNSNWLSYNKWYSTFDKNTDFNIEFNDLPKNLLDTFPIKQKLRFNPKLGRLSLINDEKICFIGYKNFQISNLIHSDTINIQELNNNDIFIT